MTPGTAQVTAEGALKNEVVVQTDKIVLPMLKIAANSATSWESISDFIQWSAYFTNELSRIVVDAENLALLSGAGGANAIQGLTTVSGALSHTVGGTGTTPTDETPLDAIETSIAQLRTGPALAEADLLILHPNTFSAVRKQKDSLGRYLTTPDPTQDTANSIWGVDVLVTTQQQPSIGTLLDSRKFGYAVVREPLFLRSGFANVRFCAKSNSLYIRGKIESRRHSASRCFEYREFADLVTTVKVVAPFARRAPVSNRTEMTYSTAKGRTNV